MPWTFPTGSCMTSELILLQMKTSKEYFLIMECTVNLWKKSWQPSSIPRNNPARSVTLRLYFQVFFSTGFFKRHCQYSATTESSCFQICYTRTIGQCSRAYHKITNTNIHNTFLWHCGTRTSKLLQHCKLRMSFNILEHLISENFCYSQEDLMRMSHSKCQPIPMSTRQVLQSYALFSFLCCKKNPVIGFLSPK